MATIHPSRLGLVPHDARRQPPERLRGRSPSPRASRRSPSPRRRRSYERDAGSRRDYEESRSRRDDRDRERDDHRSGEKRRASPEYDDYRRPAPPVVEGAAPWRQAENMYPGKHGNPRTGPSYGGGGGTEFLESRRAQREAQTVNVWPSSPKAPARELSPKRKKSSKSKRNRSPSTSDTDSSEEERRRKERKERKRARRREKDEQRDRKRRHRSTSRRRDSDSEDDRRHRESRRTRSPQSDSRSQSIRLASRSRSPRRMEVDLPDKSTGGGTSIPVPSTSNARQVSTGPPPSSQPDDSDEEVGPQPVLKTGTGKKFDERAYGGSLLRGEGSAMAAFLQEGTEARIPRRGEIGLTSGEIAKYEDVGYVMSGSRHRRMNAVRMRKENQVISAEEKRGILKLQREERERRESILREEFSELVAERLKGQPGASASAAGTK